MHSSSLVIRNSHLAATLLLVTTSLNVGPAGTSVLLTILVAAILIVFKFFKITLSRSDAIVFFVVVMFIPLAIFNGAEIYRVVAAELRFLAFFIVVNIRLRHRIDVEYLRRLYVSWVLVGAIFFVFQFIFQQVDYGLLGPRFSGYMYDSNYFSILSIGIVILLFQNGIRKTSHLIPIVISFSLTSIVALISVVIIRGRLRAVVAVMLIIFPLFIFTSEFQNFVASIFSDLEGGQKYVSERLHSFNLRYDGWRGALDYLFEDPSRYMLGLGSGRSYEFGSVVLHSYFIQTLVDKGLIVYFVLTLYIYTKYRSNHALLMFFAITSLMFDSYSLLIAAYLIFLNNHIQDRVARGNKISRKASFIKVA
jgi:hypothetical protein